MRARRYGSNVTNGRRGDNGYTAVQLQGDPNGGFPLLQPALKANGLHGIRTKAGATTTLHGFLFKLCLATDWLAGCGFSACFGPWAAAKLSAQVFPPPNHGDSLTHKEDRIKH